RKLKSGRQGNWSTTAGGAHVSERASVCILGSCVIVVAETRTFRDVRSALNSFICRACRTTNGWARKPQPRLVALPHESLNALRLRGTPASGGSIVGRVANSSGLRRNAALRAVVDKAVPHN